MTQMCIVKDCRNGSNDSQESLKEDIRFFCMPNNTSDRLKWERFSGRKFQTVFPEHAVYCSHHFRDESMVKIDENTYKLLPHATPVLNPPNKSNLTTTSLNKRSQMKKTAKKRGRPRKHPIPTFHLNPTQEERSAYIEHIVGGNGTSNYNINEPFFPNHHQNILFNLPLDKILDIFKKQSSSPWCWVENSRRFYFFKAENPPDCDLDIKNYDDDGTLPLLPVCGECLIIDKSQNNNNGGMILIRRGERIQLNYVAPDDFDQETLMVFAKASHVQSFIQRLKARNDPVQSVPEVLKFHAHSLQTLGKCCLLDNSPTENPDLDERLGTALNFLSNQLTMWITKCTEYQKLPAFVPSAIRLALLVKAQSRSAYSTIKFHGHPGNMDFKDCLYSLFQTLRECDQLLMPSETVLAPFSLVKSPQGLTNQRFSSLRALADKLNPLDRYVSVIIDEMLLTPRLVFDSNGMIIGHAVNDTVASSGEIESIASAGTPNDALANRMICYMAQGIAQNFHQVVAMYPVVNASIEFLKKSLLEVLSALHQSGFQVLVCICANNITNRKIYRFLSKKTDEGLENEPVIRHPCDPNGQLILSYDPVSLMQMLRNDLFRKEEFPLEISKYKKIPLEASKNQNNARSLGSISWVLLASLKDHEEGLAEANRRAKILQGQVSTILKSHKFEKPRIDLIVQMFSPQVRNALRYYSEADPEMWPVSDVEATCVFMENSRKFFDIMNINENAAAGPTIDKLDNVKCNLLLETGTYFRSVALPCGVLVKSTAQGIVQTCNATIQLIKILVDKIGINPVFTARLQKRALWAQMVEHTHHRDKAKFTPAAGGGFLPTSSQPRIKSKRIPDDILPPRTMTSVAAPPSVPTVVIIPRRRGGLKRKQPPGEANFEEEQEDPQAPTEQHQEGDVVTFLDGGKILVLNDPGDVGEGGQHVVQITQEQAQQWGLTSAQNTVQVISTTDTNEVVVTS